MLFLPSVFAVSVRMVSNTDYCFSCETIYEICKDDIKDDSLTFDIAYYSPENVKTALSKDVYVYEEIQKPELKPVYDTRIIKVDVMDNKTEQITAIDKEELYIKEYKEELVTEITETKTDIRALDFQEKEINECYIISVKGTLKPNQAIDNVLKIGDIEYVSWAWWNSTFLNKYPIIINESMGIDRLRDGLVGYEPIKISLAGINCTNTNKSDARVLFNDTNEIPSYVSSEGYIYFTANVTGGYNGVWGYIYCGADTDGASYDGLTLVGGTQATKTPINITMPYRETFFQISNGSWTKGNTNSAYNFSSASTSGAYSAKVYARYSQDFASVCNYQGNGAFVYINCSSPSGNTSTIYEIWNELVIMKKWYINHNINYRVALTIQGSTSNGDAKYGYFLNGTQINNVTGNNKQYPIYEGLVVNGNAYSLRPYGIGMLIDINKVNYTQRQAIGYWRTNQEDPLYSMMGSDYDGNTGYFNLSSINETSNHFIGYIQSNFTIMNNTYYARINPVSVALGAEILNIISPNITFSSISPNNLTTLNVVNRRINISFDITKIENITLYYKTNNSNSDITYYINTTGYKGYFSQICSNTSTQALCYLDDNDIFPALYQINEEIMENTPKTALYNITSNTNYRVKATNISNTPYGFLEYMINGTTTALIETYYCNSSYVDGLYKNNPNCVLIDDRPGNQAYNHTHNQSSHKIIPFAIDSDGNINGVKVTSDSSFIFSSSTISPLTFWALSGYQTKRVSYTSNGGNSWINSSSGIPDFHIHQYTNDTTFYFYACGDGITIPGELCTSVYSDLMELDNLSPTTPDIEDMPSYIIQNSIIKINWSKAISPQLSAIIYNLTQYYENSSLYSEQNTTALSLDINFSMELGNYSLGIRAIDTLGLVSGIDYTNSFKVCSVNYSCIEYSECYTNNIQLCLNVTDIGCYTAFTGNLSEYVTSCIYIPPDTTLTTIDLSQQQNVILFGLMLFFWLGLATLTMVFRNFLYGSLMFFVGILLGFWSFSISWILSVMFMFFSALLFMKTAKFK